MNVNIKKNKEISYTQEILRKLIHLVSLSIPIGYYILDLDLILKLLIPISLLFILGDLLTKSNNKIRDIVFSKFGKLMRKHELGHHYILNGASWVLISSLLMIIVFPKSIAIISLSILIISDTFAALIGRKYGKITILNKTLEGSIAFFVSAYITFSVWGVIFDFSSDFYIFGTIGVFWGTIIELISKRFQIDDNISIPLMIGTLLWLFSELSFISI